MTILLVIGAWLVCGFGTLAFSVWVYPEHYDPESTGWFVKEFQDSAVTWRTVRAVVIWPLHLGFLAMTTMRRTLLRIHRQRLAVRAEAQRQMEEAQREVEALLRSIR